MNRIGSWSQTQVAQYTSSQHSTPLSPADSIHLESDLFSTAALPTSDLDFGDFPCFFYTICQYVYHRTDYVGWLDHVHSHINNPHTRKIKQELTVTMPNRWKCYKCSEPDIEDTDPDQLWSRKLQHILNHMYEGVALRKLEEDPTWWVWYFGHHLITEDFYQKQMHSLYSPPALEFRNAESRKTVSDNTPRRKYTSFELKR